MPHSPAALREQLLFAKLTDELDVAQHLLLGNGSQLLIVKAKWNGLVLKFLECIAPIFKLLLAFGQQ